MAKGPGEFSSGLFLSLHREKTKQSQRGYNPGQHPEKHLDPRMTQKLLELVFRQVVLRKQFIHNLIQQPGLLPRRSAHRLRIKHHHGGKNKTQRKQRG